jgi:hypothetical protein
MDTNIAVIRIYVKCKYDEDGFALRAMCLAGSPSRSLQSKRRLERAKGIEPSYAAWEESHAPIKSMPCRFLAPVLSGCDRAP